MSGGRVEIQLTMRMLTEAATTPVAARLRYRGEEPYAVMLVFHSEGTHPIEWIFARDLLVAGLTTICGEGDVQVWPSEAGDQIFMELCSPSGRAIFAADAGRIERFLVQTDQVVPIGGETATMSVDRHLAALLGGEPGMAPPEPR
ncbi:MAG: SsgA family sporulation/cell division regulator [Geodermatophilaceae bacterium]|nr:SsgA family sporulation/cell division regulator [Geodermatophilaceae bacterium]